jgi:hypothetical protein
MVLLGDAFFLDEATKATSLHTAPKERVGRTQTTATELPVHHLDYAFGRKVLFSISTSAFPQHIVVYCANLRQDGTFKKGEPLEYFWVSPINPSYKEEVGYMAKSLAFGYVATSGRAAEQVEIGLNALRSRKINVFMDKHTQAPVATGVVKGREIYLDTMFVHATSSWVGWSVVYVDVAGRDVETGETVRERIQ